MTQSAGVDARGGACTGEAAKAAGVVDAFGRGTGQIVWARGPWMPAGDALMTVDVVADVKPYLLTSVKNGLGLETRVQDKSARSLHTFDKTARRGGEHGCSGWERNGYSHQVGQASCR